MRLVIPPFLDVPVRYKKVDPKTIVPRPVIKMKTKDGTLVEQVRTVAESRFVKDGKPLNVSIQLTDNDGKEIPISEALEVLDRYEYVFLDALGRMVDKKEVRYYAVMEEGQEQEVSPFDMTDEITIPPENWVPAASVGDFLIESVYQLFETDAKVTRQLYETAEKVWAEDKVGITTFSWGRGFLQYYALVEPILQEGKFLWLMKLIQCRAEYHYLMDIPSKVEVPTKPPTLKTLPPVQELIVATRR